MTTRVQSKIKGKFLSVAGNVKVIRQIEKVKNIASLCRKFVS